MSTTQSVPTQKLPSDDELNSRRNTFAVIFGLLFIIIAAPVTFKLVNHVTSLVGLNILHDNDGCPNVIGLILHGIVFALLVRLLMELQV